MTDISRCIGIKNEVICQSCYRNRPSDYALPNQSFFSAPIKDGECVYYIPTKKEDEQ